jgi:hypothetical protein
MNRSYGLEFWIFFFEFSEDVVLMSAELNHIKI